MAKLTLVWPLRLEVSPLVVGEPRGAAEALTAHLAGEGVLAVVGLGVRLQVVDGGEAPAAVLPLTAVGAQLVVGLQVALQLVGGGEGPAAALHCALEGPLILGVEEQVKLQLLPRLEAARTARLRAAVGHQGGFFGQPRNTN